MLLKKIVLAGVAATARRRQRLQMAAATVALLTSLCAFWAQIPSHSGGIGRSKRQLPLTPLSSRSICVISMPTS